MNYATKSLILCITLIALGASACSQQAWYEGAKQNRRNECYKMPPSAREECLQLLDGESYDEYKRKRDEELKK